MSQHHIVIGCGVIGLTTALELLKRGHQVTLIDSARSEGLGTSFANGGLLTPSMSDPWNSPGVHRHLLEYLVSSSSALKLRLKALPSLMAWGPKFLLNSRPAPYRTATMANLQLANYSLAVTREINAQFGISFDEAYRGTMKIFRASEPLEAALGMTELLRQHGLEANALDRDQAIAVEPCLGPARSEIFGAIHFPNDASGDAHHFCKAVAQKITALGGNFRFGAKVKSVEVRNGRVTGVRLDDSIIAARNVIIATGVTSPELASKLGLKLSIKPVKGYSMTYTLPEDRPMPRLPVIDDAYHAALTPLGRRLRVAGTAEFAGHDLRLDKRRVDNLTQLLRGVYPDLARSDVQATGQAWAGLRPVAADGRPYIGAAPIAGAWINSGHGHLGWTLAAGSARLLADLIDGARPEIDPSYYATSRR